MPRPLPKEFLDWQVKLRRETMVERNGAPHIGVVPTVAVARPATPKKPAAAAPAAAPTAPERVRTPVATAGAALSLPAGDDSEWTQF